jgi:hypothetical protein
MCVHWLIRAQWIRGGVYSKEIQTCLYTNEVCYITFAQELLIIIYIINTCSHKVCGSYRILLFHVLICSACNYIKQNTRGLRIERKTEREGRIPWVFILSWAYIVRVGKFIQKKKTNFNYIKIKNTIKN